jgi:ATP-binding cassette subfamily B protein
MAEKTRAEILASLEKPSWASILRATPLVWRVVYRADPRGLVIRMVLQVLQAPVIGLSVYAIKRFTDAVTEHASSAAWIWVGVLVGMAFAQVIINYIQTRLNDPLRFRVELEVRREQLERLSRLPFKTLEDPTFQGIAHLFDRKSDAFMGATSAMMWIVNSVFNVIGLLAVFIFLPWLATLLFCLAQVIRVLSMQRIRQWSWSVLDMETREGRRALYYQRVLTQMTYVLNAKAYDLLHPFIARWKKLSDKMLALRLKTVRTTAHSIVIGDLFEIIGLMAGLTITLQGVLAGKIAVSVIVVFIATYQRFQSTLGNLMGNVLWFMQDGAVLPVFQTFLETSLEDESGRALPKRPLTVEFQDVWFRYPGSKEDILCGISLRFTEGEHLALVGLNGAGKTTLLKLLMRIYEPTRGRILVNGVDLVLIKPSAWRKALSVLTQNTPVYDDTLREQVLYGQYEKKEQSGRFNMALDVSGLKGVSQEFSKGMETYAGKQFAMPEDNPVELSGGQNQIVAIARTLYRDAPIYIFDEPTSSVDAEKEERFFEALPNALQKSAVLFVSHRFSTLRRAERILVLDHGEIIEDGTHEELLAKEGRYAELFNLQAKMYQ